MTIIISIISCLIGFFLGYWFCYFRNGVEQLYKICDILSSLMLKEITPEEALERFNKIKK